MTQNLPEKIQKQIDDLKNKSTRDKITDFKSKLTNLQKYKDKNLLCDVSGSMSSYVGTEAGVRAIDVVQSTIDNFKGARIFEFSSNTYERKNGILSEPNGGTNMAGAFNCMKANGIKKIILLTDGQPDWPEGTLEAAKGLIIDIIYIGPQPIPQFLKALAKVTGGKFDSVELILAGSAKELENKIKGFLNA